jgi:hypothetical protein
VAQLDAMRQAWPRFSAVVSEAETEVATQYVDKLLAAGFVEEAIGAWNLLCDRELLPYASLRGSDQRVLTNPSFLSDPSGRGFDWRTHDHSGVLWTRHAVEGDGGMIDFRLSGAQQSGITLLTQVMPVVSGAYTLRFDFVTQGMPIRTGLGWVVRDLYSGAEIRPFTTLNNAEGFWDGRNFAFSVPPSTRAAVLELHYLEVESTEHRLGSFALRNMQLSLTQALEASAL